MKTSSVTLRRVVVWALVIALLATMGLAAAAGTAGAATPKYTLTVTNCGVTTTAKACKISVTLKKGKTKVKSATAYLQYWNGTKWVTEKGGTFKIKKGKGSVSIKRGLTAGEPTVRTYRVKVSGKKTGDAFTVTFVPSTFGVTVSGGGHGVGMSQFGAYQLSREGRTAAEILQYYYPGTRVDGSVNRSGRNVRVQVFGQPSDSASGATLTINSGSLTVTANGKAYPTKAKTSIKVGRSGTNATAKVTLSNGKAATVQASRLVFTWPGTSNVKVSGAHGTYRYGNLQATVINGRVNLSNELAMNTEYLYGVREMYLDWGSDANRGLEALKAQAIAVRTRVILHASKANTDFGDGQPDPACDCQIRDDTQDQYFAGWSAFAEPGSYWRSAVDQTMTTTTVTAVRPPAGYPGSFAETPYFGSTAQGEGIGTGANADVWGRAQLPYLPSVPDPYSALAPKNDWLKPASKAVSQATLQGIFETDLPIIAVEVTERYDGGLVKSLTATLLGGEIRTRTRTANYWQNALALRSPWIVAPIQPK